MPERIRVGTRGSPLALAQTGLVIGQLKYKYPELEFDVCRIRTAGGKNYEVSETGTPIRGKDAFTKNIDQKLVSMEIDIAVHSLKDLPTKLQPELVIGAVLKRDDPRDALVSEGKVPLKELPLGAKLGTSSLRRKVQLLALRPDIEVVELHGNIETRVRKMHERGLNGVILALAGATRLGMTDLITEILPMEIMLPAAGQGAIAVEVRRDDMTMQKIIQVIDDQETRLATEAERAFSERLGGGCNLPVASYGRVDKGRIILEGMVATIEGKHILREKVVADAGYPDKVGSLLAEKMLAMGTVSLGGESLVA